MPKTPERERSTGPETSEAPLAATHLPGKPVGIDRIIEELEAISEKAPERAKEELASGSGATASGGQIGDQTGFTWREQAIANIPEPKIMQRELEKHIRKEIRHLRKEANRIIRLSKPGAAFQLNELYARIRRLSNLLADILDASYEVLKRIFIRVFIDRQPIV